MIDQEHIKRVFAHQEQQQFLLELAERIISIENRITKLDEKTRERLEAFLEGAKRTSIRHEQLDGKVDTVKALLKSVHNRVNVAIAQVEKAINPPKEPPQ